MSLSELTQGTLRMEPRGSRLQSQKDSVTELGQAALSCCCLWSLVSSSIDWVSLTASACFRGGLDETREDETRSGGGWGLSDLCPARMCSAAHSGPRWERQGTPRNVSLRSLYP